NAVLAVAGDFAVEDGVRLVERHFGDVEARPAPGRADFAEPDLAAERVQAYTDRLAPLPAFAAAWRVPDPISDLPAYLPYVVLAEVLTDGDASRLIRRLVLTDRTVTSVGGGGGLLGDPLGGRGPASRRPPAHPPPRAR